MVDALRGFAVMAILLLHNVEHFIFSVYPTESPTWLSVLDAGIFNSAFALFGGKAYAIFSLLFGFTFAVQYARQQQQGKDFGYRFLWRLVGLALIATLNAAFFPGGDVLMLYAVMGVTLFIARRWSDRALLAAPSCVYCNLWNGSTTSLRLLAPHMYYPTMAWEHYTTPWARPHAVATLCNSFGATSRLGN